MGDGRRETEDEGRVRAVTEIPFSFLTTEGLTIRGDVHAPGNAPAPVVLCVHGFKGFKDWGFWPETARRLSDAGYCVVRFNFSHSGVGEDLQSFGEPELFESGTYSAEVADLRGVIAAIGAGQLPSAERMDASRIGLLGHSRGSVATLAVAASGEFPVRSIALSSRRYFWSESMTSIPALPKVLKRSSSSSEEVISDGSSSFTSSYSR